MRESEYNAWAHLRDAARETPPLPRNVPARTRTRKASQPLPGLLRFVLGVAALGVTLVAGTPAARDLGLLR